MKKTNKKKVGFSKKTLKRVFGYLRGYRILLLLSLLFAALSVALTLYVPILVGDAIDLAVDKGNVNFEAIFSILTKIGVAVVITALLQWLMNVLGNHMTYGIVARIRKDAFERIQRLPLSYFDTHPTGETVSRVISDTDQFADGVLLGFSQFFTGVITIFGTLAFMLYINWRIALVVLFVTPLSIAVASFISSRTYSMFQKQAEIKGEQTALMDETVTNHKLVTAFHRREAVAKDFDDVNRRLEKASLRATFFSSLTNPSTRFVNSMVYTGATLFGAFLCLATGNALTFTVGKLTSFLSYANQYTKPFNEISGVITELQNALACADRVFELIDAETEIPDKENASVVTDPDGTVTLQDVSFSYTPDKRLIEHLSLAVSSGQRIAIVGPTGCGKTTLINLLMRFYDVNEGSISVSGHDIRSVTRASLRASYGMVLQDTWLRAGTVKDNIRMGKPDATDEEIIAAAKASHAHSFIRRLPNGYDTELSENGGSLSQGQKQLLSITRVMLALPPMLILDEATSSIDTRTEIRIQKAFAHMMQGRTSFIVAHRLSTIREADKILVMKNGTVIEQGSHDELLRVKGFYYELYNSQYAEV